MNNIQTTTKPSRIEKIAPTKPEVRKAEGVPEENDPRPIRLKIAPNNSANIAMNPAMPSPTEINMLLKIDLSPTSSEMYLTATRVRTRPTMEIIGPTEGTIASKTRIDPIPPSVLASVNDPMLSNGLVVLAAIYVGECEKSGFSLVFCDFLH